jgi:hypothetical protein
MKLTFAFRPFHEGFLRKEFAVSRNNSYAQEIALAMSAQESGAGSRGKKKPRPFGLGMSLGMLFAAAPGKAAAVSSYGYEA